MDLGLCIPTLGELCPATSCSMLGKEHSTHQCLGWSLRCSEVYSMQELQQPTMTYVAFSNRRKTTCFSPLLSFSSLPTASLFSGKFSMCSLWTGENRAGSHDLFFAAKRSYYGCNQINFSESIWMLFRVCSASLILSWLFFVRLSLFFLFFSFVFHVVTWELQDIYIGKEGVFPCDSHGYGNTEKIWAVVSQC